MKLHVYNHITEDERVYDVDDMEDLQVLCHSHRFPEPESTSFPDALHELADSLSSHHLDAYVEETEPTEKEHAVSPEEAVAIAMGYLDEPGAMERVSQYDHLPEAGSELPPMGHITHAEVEDGDLS